MKNIYLSGSVLCLTALIFAGCGGTDTTVNINRSTASNAMGSAANSIGNAANTVANTVSNIANTSTAASPDDFMNEAAIGGMSEVELGKIAAAKATNADIKKFGQMMVDDHSKANAELKALAAKKGKTLPAEPDSSHRSVIDSMKAKTGADFDEDYVDAMVDDHEDDVAAFEKEAQNGTDADVKAFAAKTLPTLKKHLDAIKAIQAKMK
ncbi:MAG TPA: DUF4142 domain-containing protein [Pyrinomonadaceae bacterium]|nr:DUF4142 domain-containing protein [Pyrinomonadaceae bacterium]